MTKSEDAALEEPDTSTGDLPGSISRTRLLEAISQIRREYKVTPRNNVTPSDDSGSLQPVITLTPTQTVDNEYKCVDVHGVRKCYWGSFYELRSSDHYPWENNNSGVGQPRNEDRVYCRYMSEIFIDPDNSHVYTITDFDSMILFKLRLFPEVVYLADLTVGWAGQYVVNSEIMEPRDNHIFYVFTTDDFPGDLNYLPIYCIGGDESDRFRHYMKFHKLEIYQIN